MVYYFCNHLTHHGKKKKVIKCNSFPFQGTYFYLLCPQYSALILSFMNCILSKCHQHYCKKPEIYFLVWTVFPFSDWWQLLSSSWLLGVPGHRRGTVPLSMEEEEKKNKHLFNISMYCLFVWPKSNIISAAGLLCFLPSFLRPLPGTTLSHQNLQTDGQLQSRFPQELSRSLKWLLTPDSSHRWQGANSLPPQQSSGVV